MLKRRVMIACDIARLLIIASVPVAWAASALTTVVSPPWHRYR
jgi:hypothetical protein